MTEQQPDAEHETQHTGHHWMMLACCIPMLVIAIALVAAGVVGFGFILAALGCTAMMFMMMRAMGNQGSQER